MALIKRGALRRRSTRPIPAAPIRIAVAGAMCIVLAIVASRAFDELVWPLLVSPTVVTLAAVLTYKRRTIERWGALAVGVIVGAVAAGVLADGSVSELVTAPFTGVKRLLTTEWPSPTDPRIVLALALGLAVVTAVAVELAGHARLHVAPLFPILVGFVGAMAVAAPVRPTIPTVVALAIGALILLMLRPDDDARARLRTLAADRPVIVATLAILVAGGVAAAVVAWTDRADPRVTKQAEATLALLDPVEETVALRDTEPPFELFRITDRSTLIGPSLPSRWRTSALNVYDGQRWTPGVTLRPIGSRLGLPTPARPDIAPPIEFELELLSDDLDLVPIPGRPLAVDTGSSSGVETDLDRTVVRLAEQPRVGLTISASAEAAPGPAAARVTTIGTRQVDEIAAGFTDAATSLAGEGTVLEQLQTIERTMQEEWFLDNNAPGGGQQLALIERFVTETHVGTEEQFVTAFVLLARSLGVDARVATGFVVPPGELDAPLDLRSTHAAVWPEVALEGFGWMAFDPAPAEESGEAPEEPPAPSAQSPAAAQPPIVPPAQPADDEEATPAEPESDSGNWARVQTWLTRAGVVAGGALLPIVTLVAVILGLKWLRRRRRLRAPDPGRRIAGAWANTTDSLIDAGLTIRRSWTNLAIAEHAAALAPTAPVEMRRLAATATAVTFSDEDQDWDRAQDAIAASRSVDAAIRSDLTRWQRVRWRLSLRSLRRPTRSPVVA